LQPDPPVLISQLAAETNVLKSTLSLFDLSVPSFPFTSKWMKKILEGQLFVDLMLEQAGISVLNGYTLKRIGKPSKCSWRRF
jgi:hypothetical protein